MERRVAGVEQSIEIARTPPGDEIDPHVEDGRDVPNDSKRKCVEVASFDARDGRGRNADPCRKVALAPSTLVANRPDRRSPVPYLARAGQTFGKTFTRRLLRPIDGAVGPDSDRFAVATISG